VKSRDPVPPNNVQFIVSTEMTRFDVKNYLEKIYNVPVKEVRLVNVAGEYKRNLSGRYIIKDDDFKVANVVMPDGHRFEFPNLFPEEKKKESEKELETQAATVGQYKEKKAKNRNQPGIPLWFGS